MDRSVGRLDGRLELLLQISAAIGASEWEALGSALDTALEGLGSIIEAGEIEEAILQSHLFVGYPSALNALSLWRERLTERVPEAEIERTVEGVLDWGELSRRGAMICKRVYGSQYERLRANIAQLHPDLEGWMLAEGYGKVLGRPGLDLKARELCIAVTLSGIDAGPQLYSHLRGSLQVGAEPAEVEAALEIATRVIAPERGERAWEIWTEVRERWESRWRDDVR